MSYKALFFIAALGFFNSVMAQKQKVQNLTEFDEVWLHFGFGLSFNNQSFELSHDPRKIMGDSLFGIEAQPELGFNINLLAAYHLNSNTELRFFPGISFGTVTMLYTESDFSGVPKTPTDIVVESTNIEFPLFLKFRSDRLNNFAMYGLLGGYYFLDLAAADDVDNSSVARKDIVLKTKKHNYGLAFGAGMDFFMSFYKMSLELKYNMGLNNILIQDRTFYSRPIDSIKERMLTLSITFEG